MSTSKQSRSSWNFLVKVLWILWILLIIEKNAYLVGLGIVWGFFDTGAKSILLKRYRCLNSAWTDTYKKRKLIIGLAISTKHMGPDSQTGLRLTLDYTSLYQKFDYSLFLNLSLSLLPLLACTYLNNAWDLVLRALPLYVCLFKMNRFMYSPIVSHFE